MPALALTDFCNLHGIPEFCRSAKQYGIKPILGMESVTAERSLVDGGITYGLTLLAMNEEGWQNLMQLSSLAFLKSFYGTPTIDKELLRKHNAGLICLSGFAGGEIGRSLINDLTGGYEKAKAVAQWYLDIFGDRYYLELRNHGIEAQDTLVWQTIDIGWELNIPTVATHDIHYLNREDCKLHDLLLCIKNGKTVFDEDRPRMESDQHFFCLPKVWGKFRKWRREWYAAENRTVEIADRIDPDIFSTFYSKKHHSVFPLPPSKSADEWLRELCLAGFEKRYANSPFADEAKQRLEWELTVIQKIGQANYFLIAGDIVRYSKEQKIFHAARGSANGSLVCYVLGISHVCPLEFGLLFERFSCWNQNESPNIDIDFEQDRRVEIIAYAAEKYGKDCIVSLGTISTFGLKSVIKDIGRALDRPIQFVDDVVKLIPSTLGMTVDKALEESAELQKLHDTYSQARLLIDYARKIEGLPRNACIHPCGFAIADVPLVDFVPLQKGYHDVATQWNGNDIEDVGVLRLDFLGLRTLTMGIKESGVRS
jgi:DNA polymerase-3 subunit alpha